MEIENGNVVKKHSYVAVKGSNNHRWNDGSGDYKDHHQMKLNRLYKLQQTKSKCEICQDKARKIHHIDGSKDNHNISNLIVLCNRDHGIVDAGRKNKKTKTSKYIRKYGKTLADMAKRYSRKSSSR